MPHQRFYSQNNQPMSVIKAGDAAAPRFLIVHGGPAYMWLQDEIQTLSRELTEAGVDLRLMAMHGRGCGLGQHANPYNDLTDDSLMKRARDLGAFATPEAMPTIMLGHSTGTMVTLTALMEGVIAPKHLILLSPYTASLGEHDYWVTKKAAKYPVAFGMFRDFVAQKWQETHGNVPSDLVKDLYIYWGKLFFDLKTKDEKILANLHYLNFHVMDSEPHIGKKDGEGITQFRQMLDNFEAIEPFVREILLRNGTINAHWWRTNFQDGYPFLDNVRDAVATGAFSGTQIHIISGANDEITPPETVEKLADLLGIEATIAPNAAHLLETTKIGYLRQHLIAYIQKEIAPNL